MAAPVWVGDSNPIAGTTSAQADGNAWDTAPTVGDYVLLIAETKQSDQQPATPAGWQLAGSFVVGTGAVGSNSGPVRITVFSQRLAGALTVPTLTISGGTATTISASLCAVRVAAWESLELTFCSGTDSTADTSWSVTGDAVLPFRAGDILLVLGAVTASSPTVSSPAVAATGATFGTVNNPYSNANSLGERLRSFAYRSACSAGPATAAPVFTATMSTGTNATGGCVFVRLRAVTTNAEPPTPGTQTPGQVLHIARTAGWNHFAVDVAPNGAPRELHEPSEIEAGYRAEPYFTTTTDNSRASFWVRADSDTTPGSDNPRVELRETVPGSDANFTFDPMPSRGSGFHWIRGTTALTYAPDEKPEIVVCQLHSGTQSDMCVIRTDLVSGVPKLVIRVNGSSAGITRPSESYLFGTSFDWKIECDIERNHGRIYFNDMIHPWYVWDLTTMYDTGSATYFYKAGDYLQANPATIANASSEHGSVVLSRLSHWHPGWQAPDNYVGWPDVNAGADASGTVGQPFTRTATATGGTISAREWYLLDGPAGISPATLSTASALSFTPSVPGAYVLRHGAVNSVGTNVDDLVLTVSPASGPEPGRFLLHRGVM